MNNNVNRLGNEIQLSSGLTTLVSYPERGKWGDSQWKGNFSGEMVKEIIEWFKPKRVYDAMCGSGTTIDVCKELNVDCVATDLNPKYGGWDALNDEVPCSSDLTILHPPYHSMIKYSGKVWGTEPDPRDLSRCVSYQDFISKMDIVNMKLFRGLRKGGRLAILVGDYKQQGRLYSIQKDLSWLGTPEQVIIKVQHNAESYRKKYLGRFIPIVHEYLLIFRKTDSYLMPVQLVKTIELDQRDNKDITWRDVVHAALERLGGRASLSELYEEIKDHAKCLANIHWKAKIRQVLQLNQDFANTGKGLWAFSY